MRCTAKLFVTITLGLLTLCTVPKESHATEDVAGRYIPGMFAGPGAGIVPPVPGVYWLESSIYYQADAGANLRVPIAGSLQLGVETEFWATSLTGLVVPGVDLGEGITYAFGVTLPFVHNETTADLGRLSKTDELSGLGDVAITPVLLGWTNGTHFLSAGLTIYAPTGKYEPDQIAIVGLNYWTVTPTLAYTYLDTANGIDFSVKAGVDINTENEHTDYYSGAMFHMDASLTKNLTKEFAVGAFGSVLYQIEDDESRLADQLNGFRGRSFGVGPLVRYATEGEGGQLSITLSWAHEFAVKNRLKGDAVYLNILAKF